MLSQIRNTCGTTTQKLSTWQKEVMAKKVRETKTSIWGNSEIKKCNQLWKQLKAVVKNSGQMRTSEEIMNDEKSKAFS